MMIKKIGKLLLLFLTCVTGVAVGVETPDVLIRAARLFDGTSAQTVSGTDVLVRNGRIAKVGTNLQAPPGTREIVLPPEATLLPGLIDSHTHLTYSWSDTTSPPDFLEDYVGNPCLAVLQAASNAEKTLRAGFTTVRDMGAIDEGDLVLAQGVKFGLIQGPRILTCGALYMPWGGVRKDIRWPPQGNAGNRQEIAAKTRQYLSDGCDWIKMYCTSGTFDDTTGAPYYTEEEIRTAVDIAHPRNHWVAAHTMGYEGARRAVAAGVRSIEHGSRLDGPTVRAMAREHVYLVPTLYHLEWYAQHGEALGYGPGYTERLSALQEIQFESLRRARKAGVPVGCGSDAVYDMHGKNAQELIWLVKAGFSPVEALRAATSVNAALLGLESEIGRIAPGYAADLVAVTGNPTEDISAISRVAFVMQAGRVVLGPQ